MEEKKSDSEFLTYSLMWNSGKNIRALRDKNLNIQTLVLSEKKILKEAKNHNLPFKLNGRSLRHISLNLIFNYFFVAVIFYFNLTSMETYVNYKLSLYLFSRYL